MGVARAKRKPRRMVLNISGEIFETFEATLRRFPETLLGDQKKRHLFYCHTSQQYHFNRSLVGRLCFDAILYFYQSNGILSCPPEIPVELFREECQFFQLPYHNVNRMVQNLDPYGYILRKDVSSEDPPAAATKESDKSKTIRVKVWDILENPRTSISAKLFAFTSLAVVLLSVITSTLETLPYFMNNDVGVTNHWLIIDLSINVYFLTEFLLRVIFCPNKLDFVMATNTWLDGVAVIPYFVLILATKDGLHQPYHHRYLRLPRFIRILRLFRLSDYSRRLRIVEEIFKSSFKDIQLLIVCMSIIMVFGGSVMFVVEEHSNPVFLSTPAALWWAVQTVTTVGYGDIVPKTFIGKILATCLMVFGAGTMTLPILGIITKFTTVYSKFLEEEHKDDGVIVNGSTCDLKQAIAKSS